MDFMVPSFEKSEYIILFCDNLKSEIKISVSGYLFPVNNLLKKANGIRVVNILDYENTLSVKNFHPKKIIDNWMFANSIHVIDYANFLCRGKLVSIKKNIFSKQKKLIHLIYSSGNAGRAASRGLHCKRERLLHERLRRERREHKRL